MRRWLPRRRVVLGVLSAMVVFVVLVRPSFLASLYVLRESLRFMAWVGIMDPAGGLGGQVLRYNYYGNPDWARWVGSWASASVGFAPAVVLSVLVGRRVAGGMPVLWCGRPDVRRAVGRRLVVAVVCYGLVSMYLDHAHRWTVSSWIMSAGEADGCVVPKISGMILMGEPGPFHSGARAGLWNWAYRHGTWLSTALVSFGAAGLAYGVCAGPLGRTRWFGHFVAGSCVGCGYSVEGFNRCPECGRDSSESSG